ncbi:GGDEF domain-containing protein [Caldimonas brevitalea]|uniref:diguanylate cyclase n=1 Tax=Caldimonas brevitalea TaxID=413882 RepID=A0A0G3BS15_9BURK|nr:GGDEF domain-containing protein [Caldimonas brevitalea]AKJ32229.1 hypothetical protein AAW51_5538 [Caldimonas brevitalea]
MKLDAQTLFLSMWANVTLTSIALLIGVNWRQARSGIRAWHAAMWLQSLGWALLMGAYRIWPMQLSTAGVGALLASHSCAYLAAQAYLRQPAHRWWVYGLPAAATLLHWISFHHFAVRIAVVNAALAAQMSWLAWLLLRPRVGHAGWRWRWLAGTALLASALLVFARTVLAMWAPSEYPAFDSPHPLNVLGLVVANAGLMIATLAFLLAHRDEAEQELERRANIDGLTGSLNRRVLLERGEQAWSLARRHGQRLAVLMLDIDHFKQINDQRGHPVGDHALVLFAQALQRGMRPSDLAGRYGGEEFCVVLPLSGLEAACAVDGRLRETLAADVSPALGFTLDFSAGAAELQADDTSLAEVVARADRALYRAKEGGRGRLVLDGTPA